ncbi:MAG: ABC transporter substrate-binding protein [Candidatus Aquicultorales bacterium]
MKSKHLNAARLLLALAVAALILAGCGGAQESSDAGKEPYKIGAIVSATGPSAPLGEPEKNALFLEVDRINAGGGINGHKVVLYLEDDQSDKAKAVVAADRLINQFKVSAIVGGSSTSTSMAVKDRATRAKVPFMSLAAGMAVTATDAKWTFRIAPSDSLAASRVVEYLSKTLKAKKAVVLNDQNQFGESGYAELTAKGPAAGIELVSRETYKTEDTDLTAQLTKLRGSKADALVVWGTNPGPAIAAKNARQLGIEIPYVGSHGIANKKFVELAGDASEGVVFPSVKVNVPESIPAGSEAGKVAEAFIKAYTDEYKKAPDHFAGHGYDGINIVFEAMRKAGGDRAKLRDEIEKTKGFVGVDGTYTYTAKDHDGLKVEDLIMIKIVKGEWTLAK